METSDNIQTQRLDKFLSNRGITSRRNIKKLLKASNVTVNGKRVTQSGTRIIPSTDEIRINGKKITPTALVYFMLNKPIGIISTSSDEYGRENVTSLINTRYRIFPVGRLDKDTSGLILLTNDGELTHKLTHPKFHVPKTYHLTVLGNVSEKKLTAFSQGVMLKDGITQPAGIKFLKEGSKTSLLEVVLHEGRYRQIRRMCEALKINLLSLKRIKFGPIALGDLKEGEYRVLTDKELKDLKQAVIKHKSQ